MSPTTPADIKMYSNLKTALHYFISLIVTINL